jgi:hypothetical protein
LVLVYFKKIQILNRFEGFDNSKDLGLHTSAVGDTYLLPLQSSLRVMAWPTYLGVA